MLIIRCISESFHSYWFYSLINRYSELKSNISHFSMRHVYLDVHTFPLFMVQILKKRMPYKKVTINKRIKEKRSTSVIRYEGTSEINRVNLCLSYLAKWQSGIVLFSCVHNCQTITLCSTLSKTSMLYREVLVKEDLQLHNFGNKTLQAVIV